MDPLSSPQPSTPPQKSKAPLILSILGVLAIIGVALGLINQNKEKSEYANQNASTDTDQQSGVANANTEQPAQVNEVTPLPTSTPSEIPSPSSTTPTPTTPPPNPGKVSSATYKNGTYSADATYQSPAGQEDIHVTVTLKNDVVTDSSFSGTPRSPRSQMMMDAFGQNYKSLVIGKKIDEIHLTQVSGSSLTPMGFNSALTKIEAEAKM